MLANIDSLGTTLSLDGSGDTLPVFCRCLLGVPGLSPVVDTLEDDSALPLAFCDNGKALGEGPVLEPLESILGSLKRLPMCRSDKMGRGEGLSGQGDLGSQQRGHRRGYSWNGSHLSK